MKSEYNDLTITARHKNKRITDMKQIIRKCMMSLAVASSLLVVNQAGAAFQSQTLNFSGLEPGESKKLDFAAFTGQSDVTRITLTFDTTVSLSPYIQNNSVPLVTLPYTNVKATVPVEATGPESMTASVTVSTVPETGNASAAFQYLSSGGIVNASDTKDVPLANWSKYFEAGGFSVTVSPYSAQISGAYGNKLAAGAVTLVSGSVTMTAVPEPSTYFAGLSALGLLGLFSLRNRK